MQRPKNANKAFTNEPSILSAKQLFSGDEWFVLRCEWFDKNAINQVKRLHFLRHFGQQLRDKIPLR